MLLSIVTPAFNSAKTLPDTLESVLAQTGVEIDYQVIDGGSKDGTVEILKSFEPRFAAAGIKFRWISEPDHGMYDAINKGFARIEGEAAGILNGDDFFTSADSLAGIARAFEDDKVDAAYADVKFVNAAGKIVRYYSSARWQPWMHRWGFMPAHPTVYVRTAILRECGTYKTDYKISADFEWMLRLLVQKRLRRTYLPKCIVTMRMGGLSTKSWRANLRLNCENVRAERENGHFSCLAMMLPKYCYKIWGFVFK